MPESIVFDIATKIVSDEQRIWSVFPGLGRRFFPEFQESNSVFLNMPEIGLTTESVKDDSRLRQHVSMSLAWKKYLRERDLKIPSRQPELFDVPSDRSFYAAVGNVRNLFARARKGDIVLAGQQDVYSPILVGEIVSEFSPTDVIEMGLYRERVTTPVRKVRWLERSYERRFLSRNLSRHLSNRKAVTEIDKIEFGAEIFKVAYEDYVFKDSSRYVFPGPEYKNSAAGAIPGIRLLTYFCSAWNAGERDQLSEFAKLDIDTAIGKFYDEDLLSSFEIDFKSPGDYTLKAKRASLAIVVALLVAATAGDSKLADVRGAALVNSFVTQTDGQAHSEACPVPIEDRYRAVMDSLSAERYNEVCALNKKAQNGVGLKVGVRKITGHRR